MKHFSEYKQKSNYKPSQMDLDALESLKTGRPGYNNEGKSVLVQKICACHDDLNYLLEEEHGLCKSWSETFTFEKPLETPKEGTIVEVRHSIRDLWELAYSCGSVQDGFLKTKQRRNGSYESSYRYWRIPEGVK